MKFYVTHGIKRYELAKPETMTFDEGLEILRISGGMDPQEVSMKFGAMHPAAVLALLVVSVRREDPSVTEEDLKGLQFVKIVNSLESVPEEVDAVPPAEPPAGGNSGNAESGSSASSNEKSGSLSPDLVTTPETAGTPPGSTPSSEG